MFRYFLRLVKISFIESVPAELYASRELLLLSSYPSIITLIELMNQ